MSGPPLVPPLKCQGIKTKLVSAIQKIAQPRDYSRWVEPFCGSGVVALNVQPKKAMLCDTNLHIINLYRDIQSGKLTAAVAKDFLTSEGEKLKSQGEPYYYEVRTRFNAAPTPLDFLFLNRSCFNGVIRFNRKGQFNVPYCHKPERFAQAYVTKITNQVRQIAQVLRTVDWTFEVQDFRQTLASAQPDDFVYADPPYAGRHVDYFNSWSDEDETALASGLGSLPCDFLLSTWHSNEFRSNTAIELLWSRPGFYMQKREHFYHVGSSEDLRHPMIEALISNFALEGEEVVAPVRSQQALLAL
ncbi:MAG: Dam family site-specific DNA-(adenine-N6)-methyltransferase [Verrucomicrobiaceae bacterium]|nr:Dam family site-specific DNA-(adenine-N6)-methyltransferase [Verrucomicrobiaceae bacterium]